jgi:hypothetical protein
MSDPLIATGVSRDARCTKCDRTIKERQYRGAFAGAEHWMPEQHDAQCGLPCFGAVVHGKAYRTGAYHRSMAECGNCSPHSTMAGPPRRVR